MSIEILIEFNDPKERQVSILIITNKSKAGIQYW